MAEVLGLKNNLSLDLRQRRTEDVKDNEQKRTRKHSAKHWQVDMATGFRCHGNEQVVHAAHCDQRVTTLQKQSKNPVYLLFYSQEYVLVNRHQS